MLKKIITPVAISALAAIMLLGLSVHAKAQDSCPELTRLRGDAQDALKRSRITPRDERCYRYNRLSEAWGDVAQYASDNREACRISVALLDDFERYHREAIRDRDNACAGRPLRPYGADIVQH